MIDPVVLDVAYQDLLGCSHLQGDEFWREYARIEDAALRCTGPEDHGAVMEALNGYLRKIGKIPTAKAFAR